MSTKFWTCATSDAVRPGVLMSRIRLLVALLWVGSLWTVGYVVAPTLFATLADRVLAGTVAGSLFRVEAWLSLACALVLSVLLWRALAGEAMERRLLLRLTAGMALCTLIGYFALQPFMAALREAAAGGVMQSAAKMQFGFLHGAASGIYLIQSLLGGWLTLKIR